jgi:hypothetical protein
VRLLGVLGVSRFSARGVRDSSTKQKKRPVFRFVFCLFLALSLPASPCALPAASCRCLMGFRIWDLGARYEPRERGAPNFQQPGATTTTAHAHASTPALVPTSSKLVECNVKSVECRVNIVESTSTQAQHAADTNTRTRRARSAGALRVSRRVSLATVLFQTLPTE